MKVILTEKPSVARDIAKVLKADKKKPGYIYNNEYIVTWAYGHLVKLSYMDAYDPKYKRWNLDDLPMIPSQFKHEVDNTGQAGRQFETIKAMLNSPKVTEVICATDAGREGELIFRMIYKNAGCTKQIKRLWISSMTDEAILEGFEKLKDAKDYQPLYDSALSRAEADWIIGLNATRAYSCKFSQGQGVLSVGRVQTPVLKMIVDRYLENQDFEPKPFYEILSEFIHPNGVYIGKWLGNENDRFHDKKSAEQKLNECKEEIEAVIKSVTRKTKKENPPLLYDLTTLQKDANKQFKYSANQTLSILQILYQDHKLLTYPRTSSRYLTADLEPKLKNLVQSISGLSEFERVTAELLTQGLKTNNRIINNKKVDDHHAIIPTGKNVTNDVLKKLPAEQQNIYNLAARRFLTVFLPQCIKDNTEIITVRSNNEFKTTGTIIKKIGWRELAKTTSDDDKDDEQQALPEVKKNDVVTPKEFTLKEGKTKAKPIHNEASILGLMETAGKQIEDEELRQVLKHCGLGTPATRASILETLVKRQYIKREKQKLIPLEKGINLINQIQDEDLLSPEMTGGWEKKLNMIVSEEYNRTNFMAEIGELAQTIVNNVKNALPFPKVGECPVCKAPILELEKLYGCHNYRETGCKFAIWKTIAGKNITKETAKELLSSPKTKKLEGFTSKKGKPFSAYLSIKDGKVVFVFD
jgi:DNA topoisomerase III